VTPTAIVNAKGEDRIRGGHPWIYRSDVVEVAGVEPGIVVNVRGPRNRDLGHALFSDQSQITLRMISRDDRAIDTAFWRERLERAISFREILEIDATAYRLVHGEADLLPSLVVDRYDDYLVMQALSQGMDRLTPALVPLLVELTEAKGVLAQRPESAAAGRPGAESGGRTRGGARDHQRARGRRDLRRRSVARAEDRVVSRPARKP